MQCCDFVMLNERELTDLITNKVQGFEKSQSPLYRPTHEVVQDSQGRNVLRRVRYT